MVIQSLIGCSIAQWFDTPKSRCSHAVAEVWWCDTSLAQSQVTEVWWFDMLKPDGLSKICKSSEITYTM